MSDPADLLPPLLYSPEEWAVDDYLSNVESLMTAIAQRPMTQQQRDRYAALLQAAEHALLRAQRRRRHR